MKRDGRTLDHATLETIRLMAVERVLEGEVASAVITSYGFNRTTIYKWLTAAAKPGVGLRALQARPAPGRPRRLNPDELVWSYVKRTGVARTPLHKGERLKDKIEAQLASIKNAPRLVRSFFRAPTVAYITDC